MFELAFAFRRRKECVVDDDEDTAASATEEQLSIKVMDARQKSIAVLVRRRIIFVFGAFNEYLFANCCEWMERTSEIENRTPLPY